VRVPFFVAPFAVLCGLTLCAAGDPPAPPIPPPSAELERLRREVQRPVEADDPFENGVVPDFVLLSTTDVEGEVAPCG
jgi:hypothetical protein